MAMTLEECISYLTSIESFDPEVIIERLIDKDSKIKEGLDTEHRHLRAELNAFRVMVSIHQRKNVEST